MTPADLYTAIQADPAAAALAAAGNDAGCAARMAAVLPPVLGVVRSRDLLIWGAKTGVRARIEAKLTDPPVGAICLAVRDLLYSGGDFDGANPDNQTMIVALVSAGVMTSDDQASLLTLAARPYPVTADDVSAAMAPHRPNGKVS